LPVLRLVTDYEAVEVLGVSIDDAIKQLGRKKNFKYVQFPRSQNFET